MTPGGCRWVRWVELWLRYVPLPNGPCFSPVAGIGFGFPVPDCWEGKVQPIRDFRGLCVRTRDSRFFGQWVEGKEGKDGRGFVLAWMFCLFLVSLAQRGYAIK